MTVRRYMYLCSTVDGEETDLQAYMFQKINKCYT